MITPELLDFIEAELKAGQHTDAIFRLLKEGGGWTDEDVKEALATLEKRKQPVSIGGLRAHTDAGVAHSTPQVVLAAATHPQTPAPNSAVPSAVTLQPAHDVISPSMSPATPVAPEVHQQKAIIPPPQPVKEVSLADAWNHETPPLPPVTVPRGVVAQVGEMLRPQSPSSTPLATVEHAPVTSMPPLVPTPHIQEVVSTHTVHTLPEERTHGDTHAPLGSSLRAPTSSIKKVVVLLGGVLLLALLGVGGYFIVKGMDPNVEKVFATMYASIPGVQSMRYSGETTLNFSGVVTDTLKAGFPAGYTGSAKVAFKYDGRTDFAKGIDGVHQFGITADLRSGESAIAVNSSVELRIIGDTYYIKITNPPEIKDIDLSRLNSYWIAVSPSDIAERFGGAPSGGAQDYGSFGGASSTESMRGFIAKNPPFTAISRVGEEQVAGAATVHYRFAGDPDNILGLLRFIVNEMTGSPWEMNAEEETNIKALLKGVAGDIWIDPVTYLPRKIVFRQPLRGVVSGIQVDGTLDVEQGYGEYNGPVSVSAPRPVITYEEFADDVRRQAERAKATGDARRVFDAGDIVSLLEVYRANNNDRYPLTLDELVTSGLAKVLPVDPEGGAYLYIPYTESGKVGKKFLCTITTPTCTGFHLGITLSSATDSVLLEDSDLVSETISGLDTKGCAKEEGKACYDLTAAPRS